MSFTQNVNLGNVRIRFFNFNIEICKFQCMFNHAAVSGGDTMVSEVLNPNLP